MGKMTAVNVCMHFLFVVVAFTEVAGWTYDLEEVRRFFYEQQKKQQHYHELENKDERLVENSTYKYESVYGDHYNHGNHENDEHHYGHENGNLDHHRRSHGPYYRHGSHENGDTYHNRGIHEGNPYHGSHENGDSYRSHGDGVYYPQPHHEHTNSHKHRPPIHGDSLYNYGSPRHMEHYYPGLHHEHSHHNQIKPYRGETRKYAASYGYESLMGLKLHGIMRNGTRYLEGLRLAVENFKRMVENCTTASDIPFPGLRYNGTAPGMDLFNSSSIQGLDSNMQWPQNFNMTTAMLGVNTTNPLQRANDAIPGVQRFDTANCANATRDREHVRRLADLAMHTVRQLQDLGMKKTHKHNKHEEIELLMRLAWFLERIAHITGFDPDADSFAPTESWRQPTTVATQNPLALNVSDAVKQQMMDCINENSTEPATVRCNIPVDMPPIVRMTLNIPENNNNDSPVLSNPAPEPAGGMSPIDPALPTTMGSPMPNFPQLSGNPPGFTPGSIGGFPVSNQMSGLPMFPGTPPDLPPLSVIGLPNANPSRPPSLDAVQSAASEQMSNLPPFLRSARSIRKRSIDDPMLKVIKYYVKHKVWTGSNAQSSDSSVKDDLSVINDISTQKSIQKRSADEIMNAKRERMNNSIRYNKKNRRNPLKSLQKRSVKYQDWVVNRQSEDPQQDISYYIKHKPGTNIMASLVGVAQARLALERIFQTGNIEVVRRYGANYNPAIPSPFYFGLVKTLSDI